MALLDGLQKLFGRRTTGLPSPQGTQVGGRIAYPDKSGYIANSELGFNKNPVVAACVGLYASTLNEPPLGYLRTDGTVDVNHPISILFRRPNKYMGQADFWQVVWTYLAIGGNCYIRKVRSEVGNIVELIPYSDAFVVPVLDQMGWVYAYQYVSNDIRQLWQRDDVIHLMNPAYRDPLKMYMGKSPIEIAWDKINTYNELQATMYSLVASNAVPSGILSAPGDIPSGTIASLKAQLQKRRNAQGIERTEPLVLGSGMSYTQMGLDSTRLQANEMLQELEVAICGAFRIHPVVALTSAGLARSTYNNIQSAYQEFTTLTRVPFWNSIEEQLESGFQKEYSGIQLAFDLSSVQALQPDADALIYPVVSEWTNNVITLNEARAKLGFEPTKDGDKYNYEVMPAGGPLLALSAPTTAQTSKQEKDQQEEPKLELQLMAYEDIDFSPPQGVREEAAKGLEWRAEYGRGGTEVGVARARDLSNGRNVSPDTARRMASYFARHEVDKQGEGWSPDEDGFPSAGRIAWALWGGDAGQTWADKLVRQMNAEDEANKEDVVAVVSNGKSNKIIWNEVIAKKYYQTQRDITEEYTASTVKDVENFIRSAARQAKSTVKSRKAKQPKLNIEELVAKFMTANAKQQEKLFAQILNLAIETTGGSLTDVQSYLDDLANEQAKEVISRMTDSGKTLQRELNKLYESNPTASSDELATLIDERFETITTSRANTIARTVGKAQTTAVQNHTIRNLNTRVVNKEDRFVNVWLSQRDNDVRETHEELDGQWVEVGGSFDKFVIGVGEGPGLGSEASEVINCRCIVRPVRKSKLGK